MSNVRFRTAPASLTWAAGIALSAAAGCSAEPQSAEGRLTSSKAELISDSLSTTAEGAANATDAAARLRKSAPALQKAALAIEELAKQLSSASRTDLTSLREEVLGLGANSQEIERTARALDHMARAQLQTARIERQVQAAEGKLATAEISRTELEQLRMNVAKLRGKIEAHARLSGRPLAEALDAAQLGLDAAGLVQDAYAGFAARAHELALGAKKASGSPRALANLVNAVNVLLSDMSSHDRELADMLAETVVTTRDPIAFEIEFLGDIRPQVNELENALEGALKLSIKDGPSLRVLTYNTAFLAVNVDVPFPGTDLAIDVNDGVFSGLDCIERAHKIADGILRGDQDIVVLNEVFSDEARQVLVDRLSGRYPNFVAKLAGKPILPAKTVGAMINDAYFPGLGDIVSALDIPGLTEYVALPGDSGLMIFSKYAFLPLSAGPNDADCSDDACAYWGWNEANGGFLLPDEVVFDVYEQCSLWSSDCLASKGVGLVKLDTPGIPSYVAFTHLQADGDVLEAEAPVRAQQYAQVEKVLANNISAQHLFEHRVFFAGDMNTPGHDRDDLVASEWLDIYHPSTSGDACYACGNGGSACNYAQAPGMLFTDPWGFETSTLDPGLTQLNDEERLDYILHNAMSGRLCMQHVHIAYDVAEGGSHWYSDHLPVRADFNLSGDACSANDASFSSSMRPRDLQFPSTNCDSDPNTPAPACQQTVTFVAPQAQLAHAGTFQWYRITQPGSYSIKVEEAAQGKRVAFEVYQGKDLSRPVQPFDTEEHPRWGKPFAMLEPPYYVRVFAVDDQGKPDRSAASAARDYRIDFHQHLCRSAEDACFLPAALKYPYSWPEVTGLSNVRELYFKFKTSGVRDGRLTPQASHYPMVRFQEESLLGSDLDCLNPLELEEYNGVMSPVYVQDHPWQAIETDADKDWDDEDGPDIRFVARDLDGDTQDDFKLYHVKMSRKNKPECAMAFPTNLRFETNLTYFRAGRARCFLQYDDSGIGEDDHTRFHLYFDELFQLDWDYCDNHYCHEAAFDEPNGDNWLSNVPSLQGYYVDRLTLGMWEDDDGSDMLFNSYQDPLDPLHPWFTSQTNLNMYVTDNPNPDKADYSYLIEYMLCREKNGCEPPM